MIAIAVDNIADIVAAVAVALAATPLHDVQR